MNENIYSCDKWFGSDIYIISYNRHFYGSIYESGADYGDAPCHSPDAKFNTPEECLAVCKVWIEDELEKAC